MLDIIESPNPILNKVSVDCDLNDPQLPSLAENMLKAMYHYEGVGLAAPQVGVLKRIIVVDVSDPHDPLVLINPVIVEKSSEKKVDDEGCLSCPGISVPIKRSTWVKVSYFDLDKNQQTIEGDGLLARCLQHEIDHLDGKTLFESSSPIARIKALREYREAQQAHAVPGQTSIK